MFVPLSIAGRLELVSLVVTVASASASYDVSTAASLSSSSSSAAVAVPSSDAATSVAAPSPTTLNWWMMGIQGHHIPFGKSTVMNYKERCQKLWFFSTKQKQLCGMNENVMHAIGQGARLAIEECQHQFSMLRWNCSTFSDSDSIFGAVTTIKSRETAFVHAVMSAGVAYGITRACTKGELTDCNCDSKKRGKKPRKQWQWGGCSEDIHFGEKFSRDFVDSHESPDTDHGLMNLHNNEAGRRIIRSRMQRVCKCHGMSGSCSVRVCWRKLPSFRQVGDILSARFEGAFTVKVVEKRKKNAKKLRAASKGIKQPNNTELVFFDDSPDYCEKNETLGILGTHGRICNRGSPGLDGCKLLCCGRGYQTRVREVEEKCRCRFVWCCNVLCEKCRFKKEEHICN